MTKKELFLQILEEEIENLVKSAYCDYCYFLNFYNFEFYIIENISNKTTIFKMVIRNRTSNNTFVSKEFNITDYAINDLKVLAICLENFINTFSKFFE